MKYKFQFYDGFGFLPKQWKHDGVHSAVVGNLKNKFRGTSIILRNNYNVLPEDAVFVACNAFIESKRNKSGRERRDFILEGNFREEEKDLDYLVVISSSYGKVRQHFPDKLLEVGGVFDNGKIRIEVIPKEEGEMKSGKFCTTVHFGGGGFGARDIVLHITELAGARLQEQFGEKWQAKIKDIGLWEDVAIENVSGNVYILKCVKGNAVLNLAPVHRGYRGKSHWDAGGIVYDVYASPRGAIGIHTGVIIPSVSKTLTANYVNHATGRLYGGSPNTWAIFRDGELVEYVQADYPEMLTCEKEIEES